MVGRGLSVVSFKKEGLQNKLRICPMGEGLTLKTPVWTDNYLFDSKNGEVAPHWKNLQQDPDKIDFIVNEMSKKDQLKLRQIDNFISYGNIVDVSTMYPGYKNYYCAFRTYGNSWKLAVVGSKCLEEMLAVGSESNESFYPLILVKKDGKFRVLNSL